MHLRINSSELLSINYEVAGTANSSSVLRCAAGYSPSLIERAPETATVTAE